MNKQEIFAKFTDYYMSHYHLMEKHANTTDDGAYRVKVNAREMFSPESLRGMHEYCIESASRLWTTLEMTPRSWQSRPMKILDITCFATTQFLKFYFPNSELHCCDKHLKWADFLGDDIKAKACNFERDPLPYEDGTFDLVVCTEVIEHLPRSPYDLVGEMKRVLKKGGSLVLSIPNLMSLRNLKAVLKGKNCLSIDLYHCDSFGHFREYSMDEMEKVFSTVGLSITRKEFFGLEYDVGLDYRVHNPLVALYRRAKFVTALENAYPPFRPHCLLIGENP